MSVAGFSDAVFFASLMVPEEPICTCQTQTLDVTVT